MKPAGQNFWRPMSALSPLTASMMATGSVRGKCSAPHIAHCAFQPASTTPFLPPHFAQKPCELCQRNRLRAVEAQLASIAGMRAAA